MSAASLQISHLVPKPKSEEQIIQQWQGNIGRPLVSIQCMTYNHAPYIKDALNSFLMQVTDFPVEIWIHDDASTDGTREIVERYQRAYPRIIKTVLQSSNQYSQGYKPKYFLSGRCKGKYYAICEGDDFWISPNKLAAQVAALEECSEAHICIHPAYMYDLLSGKLELKFFKGVTKKVIKVDSVFSSLGQFSPTASYLMLAERYDSMPDWFFKSKDLPFGDFFIEAIVGRNGILYLPDLFSVYRVNVPGSYTIRTKSINSKDLMARLTSLLFYTNRLQEEKIIPRNLVGERRKILYFSYLKSALSIGSLHAYRHVLFEAESYNDSLPALQRWAGYNRIFFVFFKFKFYLKRITITTLLGLRDLFR